MHVYIIGAVSFLFGVAIAIMAMDHINSLQPLTRKDEQKCVSHILAEFPNHDGKAQELINELHDYVNNNGVFDHLSGELISVITKVRGY